MIGREFYSGVCALHMPAGHGKLDPTVIRQGKVLYNTGVWTAAGVRKRAWGGEFRGGGGSASKNGDEIVDHKALIPPSSTLLALGGNASRTTGNSSRGTLSSTQCENSQGERLPTDHMISR